MEARTVKLATVPPIASDPDTGKKIRLAVTGEKCVPIKRITDGVLVRLVNDGYLCVLMESEVV